MEKLELPPLTGLQYKVIMLIGSGEPSGAEVRSLLADRGHKHSAPSFYEMIRRMMNAGWLEGRDVTKEVAGNKIRERRLRVTGDGSLAAKKTQAFYDPQGGAQWQLA